MPYAIVSVYKAGEFVERRYVTLPIDPASAGIIRVTGESPARVEPMSGLTFGMNVLVWRGEASLDRARSDGHSAAQVRHD